MLDLKEYIFTPLELPTIKFNRSDLLSWFDLKKAAVDDDRYEFVKQIETPWHVVQIRPDWLTPNTDEIPGSGWDPDFVERFPHFKTIIETLPFDKIIRVYILEQHKEVRPHRDVSKEKDDTLGPSTFRCPIVFDEPKSTFYFLKDSDPSTEIYPSFPDDHNHWFCMNNYNAKHGSHMPTNNNRKLMLCIWGEVNKDRFIKFITQNIEQYKNYCITV